MTVDETLNAILQREGWPTVTNRAADLGGLTKGGVTLEEYNAWLKQKGRPSITPVDLVKLTEDEAKSFMLDDIAGPIVAIRNIDERLFNLLFDWAETSGQDTPVRCLQQAIRDLGTPNTGAPGLLVDGVLGSYTLGVLRLHDANALNTLHDLVLRARVAFYVKVALRDPAVKSFMAANPNTQLANLLGWINRANEFI